MNCIHHLKNFSDHLDARFRSQILNGPFSAVSTPIEAIKYSPVKIAWRSLQIQNSSYCFRVCTIANYFDIFSLLSISWTLSSVKIVSKQSQKDSSEVEEQINSKLSVQLMNHYEDQYRRKKRSAALNTIKNYETRSKRSKHLTAVATKTRKPLSKS